MKRVILKKEHNPTVRLDKVSEQNFYGVQVNPNQKAFVIQESYCRGNFHLVNAGSGMTYNNGYGQRGTLKALIKLYAEIDNVVVYEFDTAKELFKWLSE